jgi:PKD repeat protein
MKRILCALTVGCIVAAALAAPASAATVTTTQTGNLTIAASTDAAGATSVVWDFGDGTLASTVATHTYAAAGNYHVAVTASHPDPVDPTVTITETGEADVHVVAIPTPNFSYVVLANGTVQFSDASTGEPATWTWNWTSGAATGTATGPSPGLTLPAGTAQVTLTVGNVAGSQAVTLPVTVNGPPVAAFTITSNPAGTNTPVTFDASTSTDPNADPLTYSWDLNGDQVYGDANGPIQTKSYPTAGNFRVGVRVTDGHGGTDTQVDFVSVLPDKAPAVVLSANPAEPSLGAEVTFTAKASDTDGTVDAIEWDLDNDGQFDDGAGAIVTWTFTTPGSRIVAVRATDDMGVATIAFQTINVTGSSSGPSTQPGSAPLFFPQDSASSTRRVLMLSPFPIVRIRGLIRRRSVRISLLSIKAPKGATVRIVCRGRSCAKKSVKRRVASAASAVRFRALERSMRKGTVIQVFVTAPGRVGKYTSFRIRSNAAPMRRDRCLLPGGTKPAACPAQ